MNLFLAFVVGVIVTAVVVCHVLDVRAERRRRAVKQSRAMHPSNYRESFRP